MHIEMRKQMVVNTDPQRRCYNGCNFSEELQWSEWGVVDFDIPEEKVEERLKFWRDLNDYAVSQRGDRDKSEYRAVSTPHQ